MKTFTIILPESSMGAARTITVTAASYSQLPDGALALMDTTLTEIGRFAPAAWLGILGPATSVVLSR